MNIAWILALTIIAGQLIKLPISTLNGLTLLDLAVIYLSLWGLLKIKFHLSSPPLYIKFGLLFVLIAAFSLMLTPLHLSSQEYLISFLYTIRFFLFTLFGWLAQSHAFPDFKNQISRILIYSGVGLAILGLIQFIFLPDLKFLANWGWDPHFFRTVSTFLDPNFLGNYFVLSLLLLRNNYLFAVIFIALMTTFSRGAYLAFLISFLSLSFLNKSFKLGLVTIALFFGLMAGFFTYQHLVAEPRGVDRAESAEFRLNTWQQGWQLFQMHPVLGVGFNAYRYALKEYQLGDGEFLKSHGASTNDSSLLYVAATTGIIGLMSYLFFLGSLLAAGVSSNYLLAAGLLGLIAQSFFANTLFYPPLLLWIILIATIHKK